MCEVQDVIVLVLVLARRCRISSCLSVLSLIGFALLYTSLLVGRCALAVSTGCWLCLSHSINIVPPGACIPPQEASSSFVLRVISVSSSFVLAWVICEKVPSVPVCDQEKVRRYYLPHE